MESENYYSFEINNLPFSSFYMAKIILVFIGEEKMKKR